MTEGGVDLITDRLYSTYTLSILKLNLVVGRNCKKIFVINFYIGPYAIIQRCPRDFHAGTAVMLVQSFSPISKWRNEFESFATAVQGNQISSDLYEINYGGTPKLYIGWCRGNLDFIDVELANAI